MISKNDVKYIQSLHHKKTRDKEGLFIAEGPKLLLELLSSQFEVKQLYALPVWMEQHPKINKATEITEGELEKITGLQAPNQVLAVFKQPALSNQPVLQGCLSLVLDGIQDPGNMGTIIRIADWFGICQIIASEDTADVYNPKVVQATMGSIARVKVHYKKLPDWLAQTTVPVYGALLNGENVYNTGEIKEGVLVIGNEGRGIRAEILPFIQKLLTIPGRGKAESLNAAVATGIILSHIVK